MPKKIEGMPKGVRPRGDKFQWDCSFQGKRRTGTADTLKQAIAAREKARKDILSGPSQGKRMDAQTAVDGRCSTVGAGALRERRWKKMLGAY
jgi:hypothetical protein